MMRQHHITRAHLALTGIAVGLVISGCEAETTRGPSILVQHQVDDLIEQRWTGTAAMAATDSCDETLERFKHSARIEMLIQAEAVQRELLFESGGHVHTDDAFALPGRAGNAGADDGDLAGPSEVSDTNTQVEGVDEADSVKSDAEYIYTLSGNELIIVAAWPANALSESGRVTLPGHPHSLYLNDGNVVVLSQLYDRREIMSPAMRAQQRAPSGGGEHKGHDDGLLMGVAPDELYDAYTPMTVLSLIDVHNPASPTISHQQVFEGDLTGTRRIGSKVYLIQNHSALSRGLQTWPTVDWDASKAKKLAAMNAMVEANLEVIDALKLEDFLPNRFILNDEGLAIPEETAQIAACDRVFFPSAFSGRGLTTVITFDIKRPSLVDGTALPGQWSTVYTSETGLYVAADTQRMHWLWSEASAAPLEVTTQIHKLGISAMTGRLDYEGSGVVAGRVLNQFSLDEHEGVLRVATTTPDTSWMQGGKESESHVFILADVGPALEVVGHVDGLGLDERIYSVRFMGDMGYVVTFRQVDPLYVLDLSAPRAPRMTGELKVPGYSSYMHPIGNDHLLTIGRDATETGQVQGLQFQIFDVSDPNDPRLAQKTVLEEGVGGHSEAEYDHHAFNYLPSKGLLALPISGWISAEAEGHPFGSYGSRLVLFDVDVEFGVTPVGAVSHDALIQEAADNEACGYGLYAPIKRSVFMDEFLYSISSVGVQAHHIRALNEGAVGDVLFSNHASLDGAHNCGF